MASITDTNCEIKYSLTRTRKSLMVAELRDNTINGGVIVDGWTGTGSRIRIRFRNLRLHSAIWSIWSSQFLKQTKGIDNNIINSVVWVPEFLQDLWARTMDLELGGKRFGQNQLGGGNRWALWHQKMGRTQNLRCLWAELRIWGGQGVRGAHSVANLLIV